MNRRMVLNTVGKILKIESFMLILPLIISLIYREINIVVSFLISAIIAFAVGFLFTFISKPRTKVIYAREGFLIVALAWVLLSVFGALPFVMSGEIPSFFDAFFETVSGFTTTGASILTDVEAMSRGALFWRSFTHWVGGMGVLVFVMAISKGLADRSIHIMRAEVPGPIVGKFVPRIKETSRILYLIYIAMTLLQIILLVIGKMPLFDSVIHAFGTAGTGGFSVKAGSISEYSPYCQWVIAIFMMLFGVNFNIYYLLLIKKYKAVLKSVELWFYIGIMVVSSAIIFINIFEIYGSISDTIRLSFFQVSSIMTTTGFSTADFNLWPGLSKAILVFLMIVGACAGSTGGGLKVSRLIILFKTIKRELKKMLHPRSVSSLNFEGKRLEENTTNSVGVYFTIYFVCVISAFLFISFEPFGFESNLTAVLACFNNIGPGLGVVGPMGSYADYTAFSKVVLSFAMLFGRLEIYPLLIALTPSSWKKN